MSNQELRYLIKNELEYLIFINKNNLSSHYKIIYNKYKPIIDSNVNFLNKKSSHIEKLYCYINNILKQRTCCVCGMDINFHQLSTGYNKHCSKACANKNNKSLSFDNFKKIGNLIHNNKYTYFEESYINITTKIPIKCPKHGIFWQTPISHKTGAGCPECGKLKSYNSKKLTIAKIKTSFVDKHKNKYTYYWDTYVNVTTKMKIKCNKCENIFFQIPYVHKRGNGCPACASLKTANKKKLKIKQQIINIKKIHNIKNFAYFWKTYTNTSNKMKIQCMKCKYIFQQSISNHRSGCGCPRCNISKGESEIEKILIDKNIEFFVQHIFNNCVFKKPLPFDFFIPKLNICIEYDGEQHFYFPNYFHKKKYQFDNQKLKDKIKTEYCKNNNIRLIRIPYWEKKSIKKILENILN